MTVIKENTFESLIQRLYNTHCTLQAKAQQSVNRLLTVRNWLMGFYIVEYEQHGKDRAKYGEKLLEEISKNLKNKGLKGFSIRSLRDHRNFYTTYPQIRQTLSAELQKPDYKEIYNVLFSRDDKKIRLIRHTGLGTDLMISPDLLLSQLSFSHFIELMKITDPLERTFYEIETLKNNWSYHELKRAIGTSLAFRTSMSINKEALIRKIKNLEPISNAEIIRNPYILEFLDLEEKPEYSENDLENSILNHIQKFLIELGTGFCGYSDKIGPSNPVQNGPL